MNVLVIGKRNSVGAWYEYTLAAFQRAGHTTLGFAINGNSYWEHLRYKMLKKNRVAYDRFLLDLFNKKITGKRFDLCVSLSSYWMPFYLFESLQEINSNCVFLGWVGDKFDAGDKRYSELMNLIYYTDTQFIDDHHALGFPGNCAYMPHAVDTTVFRHTQTNKISTLLFIANNTPHRQAVVESIELPIKVIGRGWRRFKKTSPHDISPKRVHFSKLNRLYDDYFCVLNIKNETHVFKGLNQRSFEPYGCATPVLHDYVDDLTLCFDPDTEIFAYRNTEELNQTLHRITDDSQLARKVGAAGHKRVLHEHTYDHRVTKMIAEVTG